MGFVSMRTKRSVPVILVLLAVLASAVACDQVIVEVIDEEVHADPPGHAVRVAPCVAAVSPDPRRQEGVVEWNLEGSEVLLTAGPEVYAVESGGRGLQRVADTSAGGSNITSFDVSPDGEQIVYSRCELQQDGSEGDGERGNAVYEFELAVSSLHDGQVRLYTMAADGTDRRIEAGGATATHHRPQWSPDGERIAFVKGEEAGNQAIYVVVADGSRDQRRLADTVSGPSWSPDGERIAFAKADGGEVALYTIGVDGTDARRLAEIRGWKHQSYNSEADPAKAWIRKVSWSPDGSKILVLADDQAYPGVQMIRDDDSGAQIQAVEHPRLDSIEDATWSADGRRIALVGVFGSRPSQDPAKSIAVVTMAADGTDVRVLVGN